MAEIEVQTPDWTNAEYHADTEWMNHSKLKVFMQDRPMFHGRFVTGEIPAPEVTDATRLGDVVHRAMLEPEVIQHSVAIIPDSVLTANGHRRGKAWDAWKADQGDKLLVKEDVPGQVEQMHMALLENPETAPWFDGSSETETETTICWVDPETGLPLKARLDLLQRARCKAGDMKVTAFATRDFSRQAANFYWDTQMALYRRAAHLLLGEEVTWDWVVIRSDAPFESYLWTPPDHYIRAAEEILSRGLRDLAEAINTDNWHDPHWGKRNEVWMPRWRMPWEDPIFD